MQASELRLDPVIVTLRDQVDRDADRVGEADRIGAAVAFDRDAVEPEEHRAVVAARIDAQLNLEQGTPGQQIADAGQATS